MRTWLVSILTAWVMAAASGCGSECEGTVRAMGVVNADRGSGPIPLANARVQHCPTPGSMEGCTSTLTDMSGNFAFSVPVAPDSEPDDNDLCALAPIQIVASGCMPLEVTFTPSLEGSTIDVGVLTLTCGI